MLRTALLAGFSLLIAAPASAQSALETASFIIFGSLADKGPEHASYEGNKGYIKSGFGKYTAVVEQEAPCKFKVSGWEFYSDVVAPIDYTVDFTSMKDDPQVLARIGTFSNRGPTELTHYLISGVNICTSKRFPNTVLHDHPSDGTCLNLFATRGFYNQEEANRQLGAIRYMRANYCKGSAF